MRSTHPNAPAQSAAAGKNAQWYARPAMSSPTQIGVKVAIHATRSQRRRAGLVGGVDCSDMTSFPFCAADRFRRVAYAVALA